MKIISRVLWWDRFIDLMVSHVATMSRCSNTDELVCRTGLYAEVSEKEEEMKKMAEGVGFEKLLR